VSCVLCQPAGLAMSVQTSSRGCPGTVRAVAGAGIKLSPQIEQRLAEEDSRLVERDLLAPPRSPSIAVAQAYAGVSVFGFRRGLFPR